VALAAATAKAQRAQAAYDRQPGNVRAEAEDCPNKPSLAGRLLGFVGLLVAVVLLRNRAPEPTSTD